MLRDRASAGPRYSRPASWAVWLIVLWILMAPAAWPEEYIEPESGVGFPVQEGELSLLGAGLRVKKVAFVPVKIYAVALYIGDGGIEALAGKDPGAIRRAIVHGDFPSRLVLQFTRDVTQHQIQKAMREALSGVDEAALDRFVSYFPALEEGEQCVIDRVAGNTIEATMAGEKKPPISDPGLATRLFDIYLGDQPLQKDLGQALTSRAAELLVPR